MSARNLKLARRISELESQVDFALSPLFNAYKALELRVGGSRIIGVPVLVRKPERYASLFPADSRILRLHVVSNNRDPLEVTALLNVLERRIPEIKSRGYSGFVGFTESRFLLGFAARKGAKEIKPPASVVWLRQIRFWLSQNPFGYLSGNNRLLEDDVRGVVFRFP